MPRDILSNFARVPPPINSPDESISRISVREPSDIQLSASIKISILPFARAAP